MIKAIAGTKDILPEEIRNWTLLEELVRKVMRAYNYEEIRTPVFEETRLFSRGIGESADIVSKEMYTFTDRSGTSVTLKPEMTASVARALLEHSLDKRQRLNKLFYISPMFRQERPQAGRLRQFHQFGAEALGSVNPTLDAEMILIAYGVLEKLGLKNLSIKINSLGVPSSREKYNTTLKNYLSSKFEYLSEESKKRFDTNVLRIFDSKKENDQKIMEDAPRLLEHLDDESLEHFEKVKQILLSAKVPFQVDSALVRGLDYYTHTTFEILSGSVGAQSALCGGGRYDLLVERLGGRNVPGVGFAAGIERILLACENEGVLEIQDKKIDLYIVRLDKDEKLEKKVFKLAQFFRASDISVEADYLSRSVKAQMREANKLNAKFVLMIGGEEYERGVTVLKSMETGEQKEIELSETEKIIGELQ
ncbi:MAG: histidine--tRNA ligase [Chlorobi bacterium]|nr:histidine--tRNA ligase [Chlorobiota bacterium]